jgi:hypothetical protein
MKPWGFALAALAALALAGKALAADHATLDPPQVAAGEPVHLILSYDGQTRDAPDLAPLQQDFDILSTSRSTSIQMVNGSISSRTEIQVMLSPKRSGQIAVPPVTWGREQSNPLSLTVSAAGAAGAAGAAPPQNVFLETLVDTHDPYVQAAVNVTVRVYAGERLLQAGLEFAGSGDVLVQQVGGDRNRQLEKNGQLYDVVERHYVVFPQKSGEIRLSGAQLSGQVVVRLRQNPLTTDPFADLFGAAGMAAGTKPIRIHGDDVVLNVRPRPAGADARYWLPARSITLEETWHPDGAEVHVGDPVTRDLHLRAEGLTAAQLPDLAALMTMPDGVKAYPDQAKLDTASQGDVVVGTRDQSVAMIADHAGSIELPALRLAWWDTAANAERTVTLPARRITVLPAAGGAASAAANPLPSAAVAPAMPTGAATPAATGAGGSLGAARRDPWAWSTLAFALLWVVTLAAWGIARARGTPAVARPRLRRTQPLTPAQARTRFQAACRQDDPQAARHALLAWAEVAWPRSPPQGLEALAKRLGDTRIEALLIELDRALYRGAPWNGAPLAAAVQELPPKDAAAGGGGDDGGLAPLYR